MIVPNFVPPPDMKQFERESGGGGGPRQRRLLARQSGSRLDSHFDGQESGFGWAMQTRVDDKPYAFAAVGLGRTAILLPYKPRVAGSKPAPPTNNLGIGNRIRAERGSRLVRRES